jgi:hypothetical protein
MAIGKYCFEASPLQLQQDGIDDLFEQPRRNPIAAAIELADRGGAFGIIHAIQNLPICVLARSIWPESAQIRMSPSLWIASEP